MALGKEAKALLLVCGRGTGPSCPRAQVASSCVARGALTQRVFTPWRVSDCTFYPVQFSVLVLLPFTVNRFYR